MSKANKSYLREYKGYVMYHAEITTEHKNIKHEVHVYLYIKNLNLATDPLIKHNFEYDQANALNKAIEDSKKIINKRIEAANHLIDDYTEKIVDQAIKSVNHLIVERACRVCGCTEDDCHQCIEKTGMPCHWIEQDLCSACPEEKPAATPNKIEPIIKFLKFRAAKTKGEAHLIAMLNIPLADYLVGAMNLDSALNFSKNCIAEIETNSKYKYHNRLTAERSYDPDRVTIYVTGTSTDKKEELCGFMPISLSDKSLNNFFNKSNNSNMATSKKAVAPAAESKIENIPLEAIVESKHNPRKVFDKAYIQELADSMQGPAGLLSPITLRPLKDKPGKYEVVVGACRLRAAKILKWITMPSMVKNISDEDLLEVMIIENLNREGISPIEEAHAFKTLLQKENIDWLASKIHKPKKYIQDRLKLNDLIPEAAEYVGKGVLPLGHAVVISKLSFADQKLCLDKVIDNGFGGHTDEDYCKMPLEELKDLINDTIMLDFDKVNFDLDDETLYPSAGSCAACIKRTCNSNLLFSDITSDDKCTDASCFKEKINLHIAREKEKAKEEHGKVLSGEKAQWGNSGEIKIQGVTVKYSETPTKNTVPVVITKTQNHDQNFLGKTVYVSEKILENKKVEAAQAKEDRKKSGGSSSSSYEQQQIKKFEELVWPRLQQIAEFKRPISIYEIARESLCTWMDDVIDYDHLMVLAGLLNIEGSITSLEEAKVTIANSYSFEARKDVINKIADHFQDTQELMCVLSFMQSIEDAEGYKNTRGFGLSWDQQIEAAGLGTKKKASKK